MIILIWTLLGWLAGGIVTLLASRLPYDRPLLAWPPQCHAGGEALAVRDLWPVFGWLAQGGRCRHCTGPLDLRYPVTEALCAVTFGLLAWRFGLGVRLAVASVEVAVLWLIFLIDWQHHLILNRVTYPAIAGAILVAIVDVGVGIVDATQGAVIYGGSFLLLYLVARLLYRGEPPLGFGDVKLATLIGLMLGFGPALAAMALGIAAGGLQALAVLALGYKRRRSFMPYGTALVAGALIGMVWGQEMLVWYLTRPR